MRPVRNKIIFALLVGGASVLVHGVALGQTEIFQCTDDTGKIEYKNNGSTKGCKKLMVEPVTMPHLASAPTKASPAGFPKVDGDTQKARDTDRKRILEDELKTQSAKLADLKKEYNNGEPDRQGDERNYQKYLERVARLKEDIARSQTDVDSIQSELGKIPQ